ncbi:unnamed protein product [Paramecium octaurelia]|uniref:Uncharacterized protein n=1 Tax=Paramecium octaurelia TaxID=43137 RepID=A0A8S1S7L3_PAROT|nr:unnamed protein product [Paramecium octaurelia]
MNWHSKFRQAISQTCLLAAQTKIISNIGEKIQIKSINQNVAVIKNTLKGKFYVGRHFWVNSFDQKMNIFLFQFNLNDIY